MTLVGAYRLAVGFLQFALSTVCTFPPSPAPRAQAEGLGTNLLKSINRCSLRNVRTEAPLDVAGKNSHVSFDTCVLLLMLFVPLFSLLEDAALLGYQS